MTQFALRAALLCALVALSFAIVRLAERRGRGHAIASGGRVVLLTGEGCRLCEPAERALRAVGAQVERFDIRDDHGLGVPRTVPTALVISREGRVVMRRSGRAVIDSARDIANAVGAMAPTH